MRSKEAGLTVCLDFHYSDTWADPGKQYIPAAWEGLGFEELRDSLYAYTFRILEDLDREGLMPEYVQVGNEINNGFVQPAGRKYQNETNLAVLLNAAIKAVRDAGAAGTIDPQIIIHIAQPENVDWWFDEMIPAGLTDFDIIGFSYYTRWSDVPLRSISQ
jgi:arabinogalactan endo-1,4-beta-galactosidase